jgi:hypothetical protein
VNLEHLDSGAVVRSGWPRRRRAALVPALLVLVALGAAASPAAGEVRELDALLERFAQMPGLSASFREERHVALLREPLVSRGALYFAPPDRLLRRVDAPVESTVLLRGSELIVGSARGARTIDLDASPAVRAFVDGFRLLLMGDVEGLRKTYRIDFRATEEGWSIRLEPLHESLQQIIASIAMKGSGETLEELRVLDAGGDEMVTRFDGVDTNRRFNEHELMELFERPAR